MSTDEKPLPKNVKDAMILFLKILYDEIDKNADANHFIVYAEEYSRNCMLPLKPIIEPFITEYAGHKIELSFKLPTAEHKHGTLAFVKESKLGRTVADLLRRD